MRRAVLVTVVEVLTSFVIALAVVAALALLMTALSTRGSGSSLRAACLVVGGLVLVMGAAAQ